MRLSLLEHELEPAAPALNHIADHPRLVKIAREVAPEVVHQVDAVRVGDVTRRIVHEHCDMISHRIIIIKSLPLNHFLLYIYVFATCLSEQLVTIYYSSSILWSLPSVSLTWNGAFFTAQSV